MAAMTSSAPAMAGTSLGWTKLAASMRGRPVADRRSPNSAPTAGARMVFSFCSPSRGPTSVIVILVISCLLAAPSDCRQSPVTAHTVDGGVVLSLTSAQCRGLKGGSIDPDLALGRGADGGCRGFAY